MKALPFTIPATQNQSYVIQEDKMDNFYPYLHRHKEVQLCWIKKGVGTLIVESELHRFDQGDIFIISSDSAHLFKNEKEGIHALSLFFSLDLRLNPIMALPEMHALSNHFRKIVTCQKINTTHHTFIKTKISELLKVKREKGLLLFMELIMELYTDLKVIRESKLAYSEKDGNRIQSILNFTLENLQNNISIQKVAAEIGYTPEAFCRFFKKRTRKTYIQYLNDLRINEACQLILSDQDKSISEIAFLCGYNNVSHFNRTFKKLKSISPTEYLRSNILLEQTPMS